MYKAALTLFFSFSFSCDNVIALRHYNILEESSFQKETFSNKKER